MRCDRRGRRRTTPGWRARVVPNKYPALPGMHEVIVHSPEHDVELEDLGDEALTEVLELWRRRIAAQLAGGRRRGDAHRQSRPPGRRLARAPARAAVRDAGGAAAPARRAARVRALPQPLRRLRALRPRWRGRRAARPRRPGRRLGAGGLPLHRRALAGPGGARSRLPRGRRRRRWRRPCAAPSPRSRPRSAGAPLNFWLHTAPADLRGAFHWHLEIAPRHVHARRLRAGHRHRAREPTTPSTRPRVPARAPAAAEGRRDRTRRPARRGSLAPRLAAVLAAPAGRRRPRSRRPGELRTVQLTPGRSSRARRASDLAGRRPR